MTGDIDNFRLEIGTGQSPEFVMTVTAVATEFGEVAKQHIDLSILLPRGSQEYASADLLQRLHLQKDSSSVRRH